MLPKDKTIRTKAQLKDWLDYELPRYGRKGLQSLLLITENSILRRHQLLLRKAEYCFNSGKRPMYLLYKLRLTRLQNRYALHIPINCCGRGLRIMHVGPILINSGAQVGEDCSIHINSALVANGISDAAPILGDRVVLGFGAVVLGGVRIASDVAVGANAVVSKDVLEEDIAVAGVPAKKISGNGRSKWGKGVQT